MKKSIFAAIGYALLMILNSCSNKYYTMDDFVKVRKIDTHIHLNSENTALLEQAKEDNFRVIFINTDAPGLIDLEKQFEIASFQHKKNIGNADFVTAFSLVDFDSANWTDKTIAKLRRDFANGALGIKIWKNIGMTYKDSANHFIMIDDPKFDKLIQYVIENDKTVVGHLGEPKNCWLPFDEMTVNSDKEYFKKNPQYHMYLHPEYPSYEDQINARDRFIERHPDMRFVGAHLGSLEWSIDELAKRLDKFPNMAVDMAERVCHLQYQSKADREKVREFIIKYQDRLIYATDFIVDSTADEAEEKRHWHNTWINDWKYFATKDTMTVTQFDGEFAGLQLPKEVVNKIFHDNAIRWFKIKD
jgi:predicted TIM-barrel fold metal-dependent hydrolase